MVIVEATTDVPLSKRELSLIKEMADEFLLDFPEATDVATLIEKIVSYWNGDFE